MTNSKNSRNTITLPKYINPKFALANTLSALVIGSMGTEVKPFAFAVRFA